MRSWKLGQIYFEKLKVLSSSGVSKEWKFYTNYEYISKKHEKGYILSTQS